MTLPAFNQEEFKRAKLYLATTVAAMMGRKFEEEDWAKVYAAAKGVKTSAWSNFDVDVMNGNLGVEHKMKGQDGASSLLECCGRSILHPAGTRAFRFPNEIHNATEAAHDVLRQYGQKIAERTYIVNIINSYHHGKYSRSEAMNELMKTGMGNPKAKELVPVERVPVGDAGAPPDMRFGWLLWRRDLAEFLYFEQPMIIPDPSDFVGEWHERQARGRRLPSRNLWIFRKSTGTKEYSITNAAGAKVQPYFTIPLPSDPNLYHFRVQGERTDDGMVRVWLTHETAQNLKFLLGDTSPARVVKFVSEKVSGLASQPEIQRPPFEPVAVEILIPAETYCLLRSGGNSVSDEHAFRLLLSA